MSKMKRILLFLKTNKNFWLCMTAIGLFIYILISYETWIDPQNQSFSARSKGIKLLFLNIDQIGGKWLVSVLFVLAIVIYGYWSYSDYKKTK